MVPDSLAVRRIRRMTIAGVALLAVVAAVVSFRHMHERCLRHGEDCLAAVLIPLAVDGTIVVASMSILLANRYGSRGGALAWIMLVLANLSANVAVAEPTLIGRVIAAWPSAALIGSYELLMAQIRRAAAESASSQETIQDPDPDVICVVDPTEGEDAGQDTSRRRSQGHEAADLHRIAWQWAQENCRPDGSLPSGRTIAAQFSRSPRWGRWVKKTGLTGQLG